MRLPFDPTSRLLADDADSSQLGNRSREHYRGLTSREQRHRHTGYEVYVLGCPVHLIYHQKRNGWELSQRQWRVHLYCWQKNC